MGRKTMMKYALGFASVLALLSSSAEGRRTAAMTTAETGNGDYTLKDLSTEAKIALDIQVNERALDEQRGLTTDDGKSWDKPGTPPGGGDVMATTDDGKSKDKPGTPPGGGDVLAPALATVAATVVLGLLAAVLVLYRKLQKANKEIARLSEIASRISNTDIEAKEQPDPEL